MKSLQIIFVLLISAYVQPLTAQTDSTDVVPKLYPHWTLWVPGATHFYDGHIGEGLVFATTEIAGITTGVIFDQKLKRNTSTPYYNYPMLIGMSALNVDKCDYIRQILEVVQYKNPEFKYDNLSFNELMKAPFQPKNFLSPITGIFVGLALGELLLEGHHSRYSYSDINQMRLFNGYTDRDPAMAFYGATSMAVSWGAGVSEEYVFRNLIMPILDFKYGQSKGLMISSGIFGGLHALNYLVVNNPDPIQIIYHVTSASIAGWALGKSVQENDYKIGRSIAAHTWYNFALMVGSFLVDPKNNIFGVSMKFKV